MAPLFQEVTHLMESRRHMLEGIARMEQGDWLTALGHFDRAIEIREALSWRDDVESAWILAAAWINRSDVLRFLGRTEAALPSLDRAIEAMNSIDLSAYPQYTNRLILAWINRGTTCGEIYRTFDALNGFSKAEKLLLEQPGPLTAERKLLASMLHANRALVLLDTGRTIDGWRDAYHAVNDLETLEPVAVVTEAAIKARGILCRALALLLDEPQGTHLAEDWIARATDAAEEALTLVRSSGYQGAWVADLVRYGAQIYRICQPHFLGEFIREWAGTEGLLIENKTLRQDMANELLLARADLERWVRQNAHETDLVERAIETLRSLQRTEMELAAAAGVTYKNTSPAAT